MRLAILVPTAVLFALPVAAAGPKSPPAPSKDAYVKVRVEVEARGVLSFTDKAVTVTAPTRVYDRYGDSREVVSGNTTYTLDFARSKELRELAKALDGKEVVAVGKSELRMVMPTPRPGGLTGAGSPGPAPSPTWSLMRTIEVTRLKTVGK